MARGRHARRTGLLARLLPGRAARRAAAAQQRVLLRQVADELRHLRGLADAHADAAAGAEERARVAEQRALAAETATASLRAEVARLREELLWAWAEGRLPAASLTADLTEPGHRVVDLRSA
jgi:hypothetical protein